MKRHSVKELTISALLIALGIVIPQVMPRITVGPASFTLASHVPVFIAMFISPASAAVVALGTAFGFFMTATPVIALRALSHLVFAVVGAFYLQKHPNLVFSSKQFAVFNVIIGIIHTVCEVAVVSVFFTLGNLPETYYTKGFFTSIILLMGVGGMIHSLVDYYLAYYLSKALSKTTTIPVFKAGQLKLKKLAKA